MAESKKEKILEYKGKPLVRCGKTIYYGSMSEAYVVCLNILSDEDIKGLKVSGKVAIQLIVPTLQLHHQRKRLLRRVKSKAFSMRLI